MRRPHQGGVSRVPPRVPRVKLSRFRRKKVERRSLRRPMCLLSHVSRVSVCRARARPEDLTRCRRHPKKKTLEKTKGSASSRARDPGRGRGFGHTTHVLLLYRDVVIWMKDPFSLTLVRRGFEEEGRRRVINGDETRGSSSRARLVSFAVRAVVTSGSSTWRRPSKR